MNTQTNTEVKHYLDGMRDALSDLPAAEVAEIMDDAGAHVVEVAEEMGDEFSLAALIDRLGTPRAYAEELRVAAGYPSPSSPAADSGEGASFAARFAFWSLVAGTVMAFGFAFTRGGTVEATVLVGLCTAAAAVMVFRQDGLLAEVARLPEAVALKDGLARVAKSDLRKAWASVRVFQPLWWVGRALLIAAGGVLVYRPELGLVVAVALAALSLVAGPKAKTDRRWLWVSLPGTGFALGLLLLVLGTLTERWDSYPVSTSSSYDPRPTTTAYDNVYVFDKDGKPLTDVHLYDEEGRPLNAPWYGCGGESRHDNRYPRPRVVHDETGCHETPGVPFTVVMPTMPTTTPSPTAPAQPTASSQPTVTESPAPTTTAPPTVTVPPTG